MTTKLNKQTIDLPQLILRLAELGLDEGEIMYSLNLTRTKFAALRRRESIAEAFTKGLETRARKVEDALFRRATGFEYQEIRTTSPLTGGTEGGKPGKGGTTLKTVPPDVTAIVFWLKNMMPSKWGDEKETSSGKKQFIEALELYAKTNETDKKHETD